MPSNTLWYSSIPHIWLIGMDKDCSGVSSNILECIVVIDSRFPQNHQYWFFKSIFPLKQLESLPNVCLFKDQLSHLIFPVLLFMISIRMLRNNHVNNFDPILVKSFNSDLMRPYIICTKSLHAKIIDETIFLQVLNICSYHLSGDIIWNESEGNWKTIST